MPPPHLSSAQPSLPFPPLKVLAHRLGLIPIQADPRHFKMLYLCMLEANKLTNQTGIALSPD